MTVRLRSPDDDDKARAPTPLSSRFMVPFADRFSWTERELSPALSLDRPKVRRSDERERALNGGKDGPANSPNINRWESSDSEVRRRRKTHAKRERGRKPCERCVVR